MNNLSNEFYRSFKVDTVLVDGFHMPYYIEFIEADQSHIWLKPAKEAVPKFDKRFEPLRTAQTINGTQGSLF
ncbi:hypothetical protein [Mucilaginibacter segetis]|nr:hypothetical protein [Mucilaginibacter segetis]